MTTVGNVNNNKVGLDGLSESGAANFHSRAAAMLLSLAADKNTEAHRAMQKIEDGNAETVLVKSYMQRIKNADTITTTQTNYYIDNEILDYMEKNSIGLPESKSRTKDKSGNVTTRTIFSKSAYDKFLNQLEQHLEKMGTDTQTKMVTIEDMMGKYNSFCNGASKALTDCNQLWRSLMST